MKRLNKRNEILSWTVFFSIFLILPAGCLPRYKEQKDEGVPFAQKGDEALTAQEWGSAIDFFSRAIEKKPDNADYYYGRSGARLAKGKEFYLLTQAAAGEGEMEKAHETAAKTDAEFAAAVSDAARMLEIDPNRSDAHYIIGCVAIYQGDWSGAIEAFSEAIRLNPELSYAYQRRGEVYGHINDWENESADLKRAAELGYSSESDPEFDETAWETDSSTDFDPSDEGDGAERIESGVAFDEMSDD